MTIQEAINSGRRYRHPDMDIWLEPGKYPRFWHQEVMRTDWFIERDPYVLFLIQTPDRSGWYETKKPTEARANGFEVIKVIEEMEPIK